MDKLVLLLVSCDGGKGLTAGVSEPWLGRKASLLVATASQRGHELQTNFFAIVAQLFFRVGVATITAERSAARFSWLGRGQVPQGQSGEAKRDGSSPLFISVV